MTRPKKLSVENGYVVARALKRALIEQAQSTFWVAIKRRKGYGIRAFPLPNRPKTTESEALNISLCEDHFMAHPTRQARRSKHLYLLI
jgi:hypothetical protein